MSRLAQYERVTPAAITKLVGALEKDGLARRVRDDGDRRVVRVEATERGRAVLEKGRADRIRVVEALLKGLRPDDLAVLRQAAEIISRQLAV